MSKIERTFTKTAVGILLTAVVGVFALTYPLRNLSYDLLFVGRGEIPVEDVVLVYLDDDSLEVLGAPDRLSIDRVNRKAHAELIRQLNLRGVPVIAFDVLFEEPTKPEEDLALTAAAKSKGNVLVGVKVQKEEKSGAVARKLPFPELKEVVEYGLVEGSWSDRSCRTLMVPLEGLESLAWKAAQKRKTNGLGEPGRTRWMNYYGPPGHIPSLSFVDMLSNRVPASITITNTTTVFVGANTTAGGLRGRGMDVFDTPYNLWIRKPSSGTEVCATAYLNLRQGDWLEELSLPMELLLILLFGGLSAFSLGRLRPWQAVGVALGLGIGLTVSALLLTWKTHSHLWFPWVGMAGIQLPFALAWSVLSYAGRLEALRKPRGRPRRPKKSVPGTQIPVSKPEISLPSIPNYEVLDVIGEGGFGKVYLARSLLLPDIFHAVKVVEKGPLHEQGRFDRELRGIQRFTAISRDHPGLVQILHVGQPKDGGCFYYIMEAADDQDSGQKINPDRYSPRTLHAELSRSGRLWVPDCVKLGLALTSALRFLHEKELIHRDIKPSNIIYVNGLPKLADIGLVTDFPVGGEQPSQVGTFGYLAQEGPGVLGDIFALGQVLKDAHHGLAYRRAEDKTPAPLAQTGAPEDLLLDRIIAKASDPDASKRFQSAAELLSALEELQALLIKFSSMPTRSI